VLCRIRVIEAHTFAISFCVPCFRTVIPETAGRCPNGIVRRLSHEPYADTVIEPRCRDLVARYSANET